MNTWTIVGIQGWEKWGENMRCLGRRAKGPAGELRISSSCVSSACGSSVALSWTHPLGLFPLLKHVDRRSSDFLESSGSLAPGKVGTAVRGEGRASLVVQRLRVCLPMQGTRVRALVWEDPTCRGAAGPVSHNY